MKKEFYIWQNRIYLSTEQLDDDLYEYFNTESDSSSDIETRVEYAYQDGKVDKVTLTFDEFIAMLDDGYEYSSEVV